MVLNHSFLGFMMSGDVPYPPTHRKREANFSKNPGWATSPMCTTPTCVLSVVCLCVTLKPTVLRRGYGGGTCLRQVMFYQKITKLAHLDHVFGTSFCSFALNLKRSVIKKWSKSIEADPVLEHLFVVSHLTWRDPWSKSEQKVMKWTLFWNIIL